MSMTANDSIFGPSRGDPEVAIQNAAAKGALGPYAAFIREIYRVAPLMPEPIDPACAVAQSAQETGYWSNLSQYWVNDRNPGGVGIWKDGVPSPFNPPGVQTGEQSARLMLLEIWAHLRPTPPYPSVVEDMVAIDGWLDEVQAAQRDPNRPPMRTLRDWHLQYTSSTGSQECTWACDPNYSTKIAEHGNYLFPSLPDQNQPVQPETKLVFGRVEQPAYDRHIIESTYAYNDTAPRKNVGTCVHRMDGDLRGTEGYFGAIPPNGRAGCPADEGVYHYGGCHGLTGYGIGGYDDAPEDDGRIFMWNDPIGTRAPLANGNTYGPEGDGQAFLDAYQGESVNAILVSIELSGYPNTPVTKNQIKSLANLVAYWHDQAGVPYNAFPLNPKSGVVTQMQHYEFTDEKDCPYPEVKNRTKEYQDMAKEIMRLAQTGGASTPPEDPDPGDPSPPPTAQFQPTDRIHVNEGPLNLRSEPSVNAAIITSLPTYTQLCVRSGPISRDNYAWYEVRVVSTGEIGYVAGQFCGLEEAEGCSSTGSPLPPATYSIGDRLAVAVDELLIRAQPTTDATVTGSFYSGTNLCVTDGPVFANGFEWYQAETSTQQGWVASEYCQLAQAGGCGSGMPTGRFAVNDLIRVFDGPVNIRTEPTAAASIVYSYPTGTQVCVTGGPVQADGYEWYAVDGAGYQGWIAGDFCELAQAGGCGTVSGKFRADDFIQVIQDDLNIRSQPTTSAAVIGVFDIWSELCVISGPVYANGFEWYEVSGYGCQGWIAGDYCALLQTGGCASSPPSSSRFAIGDVIQVNDGPLNIRSSPSTDAAVVGSYETYTNVCVLAGPSFANGLEWYQVDGYGYQGWIAGDYCVLFTAGGCAAAG